MKGQPRGLDLQRIVTMFNRLGDLTGKIDDSQQGHCRIYVTARKLMGRKSECMGRRRRAISPIKKS